MVDVVLVVLISSIYRSKGFCGSCDLAKPLLLTVWERYDPDCLIEGGIRESS